MLMPWSTQTKNNQQQATQQIEQQTSVSAIESDGDTLDEPLADEIDFSTFAKVDLRIAKIVKASHVEGADKLLQLTLDIGDMST